MLKDKWTIKDFVYLTTEESLNDVLFKFCMEDDKNLLSLMNELGWQGGTIHQVESEIRKMKAEIKTNRPETYANIETGKMKLFTSKITL